MNDHCAVGVCSSPVHCREIGRCFSAPAATTNSDPAADAAFRRGLLEGGAIVFKAVMEHESNTGRGTGLYAELQRVAEDALAQPIIVHDPDEQPLWEHLIEEAFWDMDDRVPYTLAESLRSAFKVAVRGMLAKKLPAPDSENMRLREALARAHLARTGKRVEATAALNELLATAAVVEPSPLAVWTEAERIRDLPEVDEALRNFLEDSPGDNATCVVRAVMRSTRRVKPSDGGEPK